MLPAPLPRSANTRNPFQNNDIQVFDLDEYDKQNIAYDGDLMRTRNT